MMKGNHILWTAALVIVGGLALFTPEVALAAPRAPWHVDSWAALGIILASIAAAVFLNDAKPATRTMGTYLAAGGCFAVFLWFLWVLSTGILGSPRPANLPFDYAKPVIMWLQGLTALTAGVALVLAARRQSLRTDELSLPTENSPEKYGRTSRYLHWVTAALVLLLLPLGVFTSMIPEGTSFRLGYYVTHKTLGLTVLILVVARIVWNFMSPRPELVAEIKPWERRTARSVHITFYVLLIGFPVTGYVMSDLLGIPSFFFFLDTPHFLAENRDAIFVPAILHKVVLPYLLYLIIGAHVAGALKHQLIDKHKNALNRMVS